jgi:hypothetical protein
LYFRLPCTHYPGSFYAASFDFTTLRAILAATLIADPVTSSNCTFITKHPGIDPGSC